MLLAAAVTGGVVWMRVTIVPPDCSDTRTLALVRRSLGEQFEVPATLQFTDIRVLAGGYLAFRYVCEATLEGIDHVVLADGVVPGWVEYVSRLSDDHTRQEVSARIEPRLVLQRVQ